MIRRPPRSTLFPYPPLSRSGEEGWIKNAQNRLDLFGVAPYAKDTEVGRFSEQYDTLRAKLGAARAALTPDHPEDRKSTRLNSSHLVISYAVFCLKKKTTNSA